MWGGATSLAAYLSEPVLLEGAISSQSPDPYSLQDRVFLPTLASAHCSRKRWTIACGVTGAERWVWVAATVLRAEVDQK